MGSRDLCEWRSVGARCLGISPNLATIFFFLGGGKGIVAIFRCEKDHNSCILSRKKTGQETLCLDSIGRRFQKRWMTGDVPSPYLSTREGFFLISRATFFW